VKRIVKVLAVAALVAMILVTSISPAFARKVAGGQLLSTEKPCNATAYPQYDRPGVEFRFFGPGEERAEGCWALLPPSAND
jgi:hypothetical protein